MYSRTGYCVVAISVDTLAVMLVISFANSNVVLLKETFVERHSLLATCRIKMLRLLSIDS